MDNLKLNENFQELNVDELSDIDGGNRLLTAFSGLTRGLFSNVLNVNLPDLGERRECNDIVDCFSNSISAINSIGNWVRSLRQ